MKGTRMLSDHLSELIDDLNDRAAQLIAMIGNADSLGIYRREQLDAAVRGHATLNEAIAVLNNLRQELDANSPLRKED